MVRNSSTSTTSNKDEQQQNSVIIKTSRSLRHLRLFSSRGRRNKLSGLSNGTAISTVCSLGEEEMDSPAPTISTTNGTEAFLCPLQESRYLYDQGVEYHKQERHAEATESLTQALSLTNGSDLEPRILWTLVSYHIQQDEHEEALSYLTVLKPLLSKIQADWIKEEASLALLSILMEKKLWNMALQVSNYIQQEIDCTVLARIHFEVAESLTTEKALPHLEQALQLCSEHQHNTTTDSEDDETLKQAILQTMVQAHAAEEEWDEALSLQESYMESIREGDETNNSVELAQGHYDAAELYLAQGHYEDSLSSLNQGLDLLNKEKHALSTTMLQAKAHVLYQLGDIDDSLLIYKSLLVKVKHCPSDAAKLYYTMACISLKSGRYEDSLGYFRNELKITRQALGKYHYETSRIYHDIARIYDESLGDYESSLNFLGKALKVEQRALKRSSSSKERNEVASQILETQQCMGRIHYKRGEFSKAFTVSFHDDVSV